MIYKTVTRFAFAAVLICATIVNSVAQQSAQNKTLQLLFENYYKDRLKIFPLEATSIGDNRYNNVLPNDGAADYLELIHNFYSKNQKELDTMQCDKQFMPFKTEQEVLDSKEEILNIGASKKNLCKVQYLCSV